jgi:hypothetical protein
MKCIQLMLHLFSFLSEGGMGKQALVLLFSLGMAVADAIGALHRSLKSPKAPFLRSSLSSCRENLESGPS